MVACFVGTENRYTNEISVRRMTAMQPTLVLILDFIGK